jgi:hypothetical protein
MNPSPRSEAQDEFVEGVRRRLKMSPELLDVYCRDRFGKPYADLRMGECSALLDTIQHWKHIPPELMVLAGQQPLTLPGL